MKNLYQLAQMALPVLTEIPPPRAVDEALVDACQSYSDAVRLCLERRIRRMNESEIAGYLGFKGAHLAKVKAGKGYLTSDQEAILQRLCSNTAIKQYAAKCVSDLDKMIEQPAVPAEVQALVAKLVAEQLDAERARRAA